MSRLLRKHATLPREDQDPSATVAGDTSSRPPGILVVDDEKMVLELLNIVLQRQGFAVWLATNGREALEVYQRQSANIDLVLLDVRMPAWDGPQTLLALRQHNAALCCCFMTGDPGPYTLADLRQQGAAEVFLKPFGAIDVATALWQLAQSREPRGPAGKPNSQRTGRPFAPAADFASGYSTRPEMALHEKR